MNSIVSSTENFLVLIIAIIILLVVISVLGGFIDPGASFSEEESRVYWEESDIAIVDWIISGSSHALLVQNNMDYAIKINYFSVEGYNLSFGVGDEKYTLEEIYMKYFQEV